jgi:formylglycine-generating enzyme required for sulfatase activity
MGKTVNKVRLTDDEGIAKTPPKKMAVWESNHRDRQQTKNRSQALVFAGPLILIIIFAQYGARSTTLQPSTPSAQNFSATTPTPGTIMQDNTGVDMVYVPGGDFLMGTDESSLHHFCEQFYTQKSDIDGCVTQVGSDGGILNEYPVHLYPFWIDRYEQIIKVYQSCVNDSRCDAVNLSGSPQFNDPQKPQVDVTWFQAVLACNWRNARLPTEEEWEYAASGPQKFSFPWGNSFTAENIPTEPANSTYIVGSVPGNKSWVGAYDMAGNAAEWVDSVYLPYRDLTNNWSSFPQTDRVVRGSSWGNGALFAATFVRDHADPKEHSLTRGFRCARSSPPNTRF